MIKKTVIVNCMVYILAFHLFHSCSPRKKSNIIGLYYKKINVYNETEIFKELAELGFQNRYSLLLESYKEKPDFSIIKKWYRNKVKIIILEDYKAKNIKKIAKFARKKKILLSHITDREDSPAPVVYYTDFIQLGYDIINQLFNYTRSKRHIFIIMYKDDYAKHFRKLQLLKGYNLFLKHNRILKAVTNTYQSIDEKGFRRKIYSYCARYSNNIRGILMDSDEAAVVMAHILRRTGKENEIKVAGFNATLKGIDSMMKTGLLVTGDINRHALFFSTFTNSLKFYNNIITENQTIKKAIPGIYYHQFNTMDNLARTKKYSIKQIIINTK